MMITVVRPCASVTAVSVSPVVAGAGPAGLSAALTAARSGARVVLVDEHSEAGGALLGTADMIDEAPALEWVAAAVAELATYPDVLHLQRTTAFGHYDDGFVLALQRRTDHLGLEAPSGISRQRVWRIRARRILVATGAHERPVVFTDNDRPGIMLAPRMARIPHTDTIQASCTSTTDLPPVSSELAATSRNAITITPKRVPLRSLSQCRCARVVETKNVDPSR